MFNNYHHASYIQRHVLYSENPLQFGGQGPDPVRADSQQGNDPYIHQAECASGSLGQHHLQDHRPDKIGKGNQPSSGRDVELITPGLPRDAKWRAAGELHLLVGAAVVALRYLHAPENALVLRAQLSKVSESESSYPAVV